MKPNKTTFKQTEIGLIPEDWEVKRLGDEIEIKHGFSFKGEFFTDVPNENILLTPGNFKIGGGFKSDYFKYYLGKIPEKYLLKGDDLIIIMTDLSKEGDTLGYSALVPKEKGKNYLHNQRLGLIIIKSPKIDKYFLYWLLRTKRYHNFVVNTASGSTVKHTAPKRIYEYKFPLPPLPEQRAIARILSDLDAKIELNQQMNKTLEAIGQAIFKHWFIDFEFPNEEGKPYKSSGGPMEYNEELDKEIPKGWRVKPIDEIANFLNGLPLQKYPPKNTEEYLPIIKIRELRQGVTKDSDKASLNIPKEYIIDDGDVVFSWSGSLEVVIWTGGKGALNQHLFKVTSKDYLKWFYYYWTLQYLPDYRHIAEGKATTMGHIQRHHLKNSLVLIPDNMTIKKMDKIFNPIIEKIININVEARTLSSLRDALLPKLMTGKIRIDDPEKFLNEEIK
ncbi:restriction endonuclease subunit S [Melioribacter sp. OK-6-Me]|uniref:restriction endonuclease subunit S n=1 Tax=unclassified Melioribacter TaxID=2627329 RepID=UPI003EDB63CD